jgi:Fe-Mn family superoxide dismutase
MKNRIVDFRKIIQESDSKEKLQLNSLPYDRNELSPVMSKETIDYHYGKLAKSYVDRYNNNEGDDDFNRAGAFLHNIFFPQLQSPSSNNKPTDQIKEFIEKHFDSYDSFKEAINKEAMSIQGSGWVYLSRSGNIKTIKNHQIKNDILLLIDWWEHAWALDYQADKSKYLKNIWSIINWSVINDRLSVKGGDEQ